MNLRTMPRLGPLLVVLVLADASGGLAAQAVRASGSTRFQYVELRPLVVDTVLEADLGGGGLLRQTEDGRIVRCIPEDRFCRGTRAGDPVSTMPIMQDLSVTAWGFGEGIQLHAQVRGRTAWGGAADFWPQVDDPMAVLAAYGEVDRDAFRVRVGRQWKSSGLGFYNFDGLAAMIRPLASLSVEGHAGRSLVRGLNERRTGGALDAIEDLAPEEPGLLLGAEVRYRPTERLAVGALYQRDIRDDRAGLYSELAAASGVYRAGAATFEGSLELDVASGALNEGRLRVRSPPFHRMSALGELRRYRPYFELWTIWGAFSPVGFDEGRLAWTGIVGQDLVLTADASYRRYEPSGDGLGGYRTDGWGVGVNGSWAADSRWRLEGGYRLEIGFGASRSDAQIGMVRRLGDAGVLTVRGLGFQRLYEFRLEQGTVVGLGADLALPVGDRVRVQGGVTGFRHLHGGETPLADWNQLRGNLLLRWTIGSEPTVTASRGAAP